MKNAKGKVQSEIPHFSFCTLPFAFCISREASRGPHERVPTHYHHPARRLPGLPYDPQGPGCRGGGYSRAQSGKPWHRDHRSAEAAGVTRPVANPGQDPAVTRGTALLDRLKAAALDNSPLIDPELGPIPDPEAA